MWLLVFLKCSLNNFVRGGGGGSSELELLELEVWIGKVSGKFILGFLIG